MDAHPDWLNPTPEQMIAALLDAADAERWNHWEHEVDRHTEDWVRVGDTRKAMSAAQFRALPETVGRYPFVKLCVYRYRRRMVWGFYCKRLLHEGEWLTQVIVVVDPAIREIVHCMRSDKGKKYCENAGKQENEFRPVRW